MAQVWDYSDEVKFDLRKLRPILKAVPQQYREQVVKDLREAYPSLVIECTPDGVLRIEHY